MNANELYRLRRDYLQVIAMLRPELQTELDAMDKVYEKTAEAAAIIGTKEQADQLKSDAEAFSERTRTEASKYLDEAKELRTKLEKSLEDAERLRKDADNQKETILGEAKAQTDAHAEHNEKMHLERQNLLVRSQRLDQREAQLERREASLGDRERELGQKARHVLEAAKELG